MPGTQLFRRLSRQDRILHNGEGDNTGCELKFLPRMNPERLVAAIPFRPAPDLCRHAYYERVRGYLIRCRPQYRPHFSFGNMRAVCLSVLRQGMLRNARLSYWEFLLSAVTHHRRSFGAAMTLAVMGYHFQIMTERLSQADSGCGARPPDDRAAPLNCRRNQKYVD